MNGDGDCNGQVLRAYAEANVLSEQDCFDLSYFYATTYCCASAVFMYKRRGEIVRDAERFANESVGLLVFESDRHWVAQDKRLNKMLKEWAQGKSVYDFKAAAMSGEFIYINQALEYVQRWYYFSRYAAYLFIETFCDLTGYSITYPNGLDYGKDRMLFASGMFRYYGMDALAEKTRLTRKLPVDNKTFDNMVKRLQADVKRCNGDDNWLKLETSLCAYEKMFRGTRYNGYYADRMLAETMKMMHNPNLRGDCEEVLTARAVAIPQQYLGEIGGWNGIRKELKKFYKEHGQINQ